MKNIKFMSVALLAVTLGLGVASCSSDDDNNDGGESNKVTQKYISSRTLVWSDDNAGDGPDNLTATYDTQNRPIKIEGREDGFKVNFVIDYDKLTMTNTDDEGFQDVYHFKLNEQGFISEITTVEDSETKKAEFTYNSSGYLTSSSYNSTDGGSNQYKYQTISTWQNGNLKSISSSNGSSINFKYGSEINKGNIQTRWANEDLSWEIISFECVTNILNSSHLFGNLSYNLPESISYYYPDEEDGSSTETETYSYELDKDGYVTKVICTGSDAYGMTFSYK